MLLLNRQTEQDKLNIDIVVENLLFTTELLLEVTEEIEQYANQRVLTDEEQKNLRLHLEESKIIISAARQQLKKIDPRGKNPVHILTDEVQEKRQMKTTQQELTGNLPLTSLMTGKSSGAFGVMVNMMNGKMLM
jgi:hypothetical protein